MTKKNFLSNIILLKNLPLIFQAKLRLFIILENFHENLYQFNFRENIAWKNHVLKGKPKAHHVRRKYQIRQVRLKLIHRWTKRCSRHYEATQPHRQKRLRTVNTFLKEHHFVSHYKAKAKPVKPGSAYHDEPVKIPMGKGTCVICKKRTRWHCFGCCKDLEGIYPVCSPSVRNCNELHHSTRNEI